MKTMQNKESQSFAANGGIEDSLRRAGGALGSSISDSLALGKDAVSTVASEAMNSAGSELESLRRDLNSLKDTVAKFISHAGGEAEKSAREFTSNMAGQASDLADKGVELASGAREQATIFASDLEQTVRRNPLGAMFVAVMVGGFIGLMARRR
jgi:ElaB/YqjD/DUF883 family membrane-anchored ribosome-binding protein